MGTESVLRTFVLSTGKLQHFGSGLHINSLKISAQGFDMVTQFVKLYQQIQFFAIILTLIYKQRAPFKKYKIHLICTVAHSKQNNQELLLNETEGIL